MIFSYEEKYAKDLREIYNEFAKENDYVQLSEKKFDEFVLKHSHFNKDHVFVLVEQTKAVGVICGCTGADIPRGDERGYFTFIAFKKGFDTEANYKLLFDKLEESFKKAGKIHSAVTFFNPMKLPWLVPNTAGHQHNNAPGIATDTALYEIMLKNGYKAVTHECAMYMDLSGFEIPEKIIEREKALNEKQYSIDFYDENQHVGLDEMLKALDNSDWSTIIPTAVKKGQKVLVALDGNTVAGFTGPIYPEESGRGYFAGIGVASNWEGKGLGTVLFYRLCKAEKEAESEYMSLFTGETNPAINIYAKAGFDVVRKFGVMIKEI